ncbi:MAG: hypothetical protein JST93_17065 [Acidobacteria bacterium]|nr:hypothetical protein [Acidobacteriota bacterium]
MGTGLQAGPGPVRKGWPILILAFALLGAGLGYYGGKLVKQSGARLDVSYWHLAFTPLAFLLAAAWHELGHLVGGWLSGFQFSLFIVGPIRIERLHDRLKLSLNRSLSLAGGLAAATPPPGTRLEPDEMKRALFRIVAGGPLFSLIGALLLLPATLLLSASLGITGAISLIIAVATMIPLSTGGFRSDGARLLQLSRGGEEAQRWAHLAILAGFIYTTRPRDWPRDLVTSISRIGDRSFDAVSAAWLRACHHEDRGELDDAKLWIEEALAGKDEWPIAALSTLHATAASIYAARNEAALAREQFAFLKPGGLLPKDQVLYTEALVLFAEGQREAALDTAGKALAMIPASAQGAAEAQRQNLQRIIAQCTPNQA